jgi:hypothetical protein
MVSPLERRDAEYGSLLEASAVASGYAAVACAGPNVREQRLCQIV